MVFILYKQFPASNKFVRLLRWQNILKPCIINHLLLAARTIGVATNIEEYVPTITPIIMANAKLWMISPPRKKSEKRTTSVVREVKIVLESVSFILLLNKDGRESFAFEPFMFSLILSKTIIVSFNEYPIMVNRAAMMGREKSRSSWRGNKGKHEP